MPTRILRDWTDSYRIETISAEAERLFVRIIMKADDYGRLNADPRLIRAACFPLLNIDSQTIENQLQALVNSDLIRIYEVAGKRILAIVDFRQRMRASVGKFPAPVGQPADWCPTHDGQVSDNCQTDDGHMTARGGGGGGGGDVPPLTREDVALVLSKYPKQSGIKGAVYSCQQAILELRKGGDAEAVKSMIRIITTYASSDVVKKGKVYAPRRFFEEGHYNDDPATWGDAKAKADEPLEIIPDGPDIQELMRKGNWTPGNLVKRVSSQHPEETHA